MKKLVKRIKTKFDPITFILVTGFVGGWLWIIYDAFFVA